MKYFRKIRSILMDCITRTTAKYAQEELLPPKELVDLVGGGDYTFIGEIYFKCFQELCGLSPNEKVLDVGCGVGRMAVPLTKYLTKSARYEGFDIVCAAVDWCKKNITSKHPNFSFALADIYNKQYNPTGKFQPFKYAFPYGSESFDFVFLTSIFTHMMPSDIENYISEIARVLKVGGRCFITFFLLNEESLNLIKNKKSQFDFKYNFGIYRTINEHIHEAAISCQETYVRNIYKKYGLKIQEPVYYGAWCGRKSSVECQDIVLQDFIIAVK